MPARPGQRSSRPARRRRPGMRPYFPVGGWRSRRGSALPGSTWRTPSAIRRLAASTCCRSGRASSSSRSRLPAPARSLWHRRSRDASGCSGRVTARSSPLGRIATYPASAPCGRSRSAAAPRVSPSSRATARAARSTSSRSSRVALLPASGTSRCSPGSRSGSRPRCPPIVPPDTSSASRMQENPWGNATVKVGKQSLTTGLAGTVVLSTSDHPPDRDGVEARLRVGHDARAVSLQPRQRSRATPTM